MPINGYKTDVKLSSHYRWENNLKGRGLDKVLSFQMESARGLSVFQNSLNEKNKN